MARTARILFMSNRTSSVVVVFGMREIDVMKERAVPLSMSYATILGLNVGLCIMIKV